MLERTVGITNEVLEPITFVVAYPTVYSAWCFPKGADRRIIITRNILSVNSDVFFDLALKALISYSIVMSYENSRLREILYCCCDSAGHFAFSYF
jgi:hypothetical protein